MKKTMFIILLLGTLAFLAAQTQFIPIFQSIEDDDGVQINYDDEIMLINESEIVDESGYLGIYVDDLNFPKAQALKYSQNKGVLVIGVVADSPASDATLQADDIIMTINGEVVENKEQFIKLSKKTRPGDLLKIKIWRAGEEKPLEITLANRMDIDLPPSKISVSFKPNLSTGYGGGSWTPVWTHLSLKDINDLLEELYFEPMQKKGLLLQGGAGKIHVGKGFFFGIQGASFADNGKRNNPADSTASKLSANYKLKTFGFTMDKRFAIKPWLLLSIGTALGSAQHKIELYRDESDSTWPANNNYNLGYHKAVIKKDFLTVHPRIEALFPILSWFGMRIEAGYNYGFSPNKGWKEEEYDGSPHQLSASPETKFGAFTISAGPWFGF